MTGNFWVYILECNNGSLYTGYTNDLQKRYQEHREGKGAKYTRSFKPVAIVKSWRVFTERSVAMQVEAYIKKLSRGEKLLLVEQPHRLVELFGEDNITI